MEATRLQKDGRIKAGNRRRDKSHQAFERLRATPEGVQALFDLLDDPSPQVRHDVAGRLLPDPRAVEALERWAAGSGSEADAARFTLKYFRMANEQSPGPSE